MLGNSVFGDFHSFFPTIPGLNELFKRTVLLRFIDKLITQRFSVYIVTEWVLNLWDSKNAAFHTMQKRSKNATCKHSFILAYYPMTN